MTRICSLVLQDERAAENYRFVPTGAVKLDRDDR